VVFADTETGLVRVAVCHPVALSPVNVTVASRVPPVFHSEPVCVPVLPLPL
jgi:hypothetical protein